MGVAGVGKSTIAEALSKALQWPYAEGDTFHPPANVAKMSKGLALTDGDRWPWLSELASWIGVQEKRNSNCLVTCSALRVAYRDALRVGHPSVWFVHLVAPRDVVENRISGRIGHFMPLSLLTSQIEALEPLGRTEPGVVIPATEPTDLVVRRICSAMRDDGLLG